MQGTLTSLISPTAHDAQGHNFFFFLESHSDAPRSRTNKGQLFVTEQPPGHSVDVLLPSLFLSLWKYHPCNIHGPKAGSVEPTVAGITCSHQRSVFNVNLT